MTNRPSPTVTPNEEDARWRAVEARDGAWDGRFVYGVVTTGVFCRPSCPSRRPARANVRLFATAAEAARAGLRPCKRCRPDAEPAGSGLDARIARLCGYLEAHADEAVTLADMSRVAGASAFHLQRRFKSLVGLSPRQYHEACRTRAFKRVLREGSNVTDAIFEAGYGSASRVYEGAAARLGMTPREYRSGGARVSISYAGATTAFGVLLLAATDRGLCAVRIGDDEGALVEDLRREFPEATFEATPPGAWPALRRWLAALAAHLEEGAPAPALPRDVRGTAFQERVWRYLARIPRGETRTYAEVAEAIDAPRAARAVGAACAANPLAVAIPCHRVVRGDGGLGGYRWGVARKERLLTAEREEAPA